MREQGQRTTGAARALSTYVKLMRATETVTNAVHRHLVEDGLSLSQFGVLEALYHLGPLCQRDLGRKILKSSGNVTTVIDNLEKRGLATRQRQSSDRRFITVQLTPAGEALIARIFPRHVPAIIEALEILTPAEQEELARLCRKLGRKGDNP